MNFVFTKTSSLWRQHRLSVAIFAVSVVATLAMLALERMVGIAWDFHPDANTYATKSFEMARAILEAGPRYIFNNAHYFLSAALNQNVGAVTAFNMVLFGFTNVLLWKNQRRFLEKMPPWQVVFFLGLLLLNPYRVHLATTMLKDTVIIFLFVVVLQARYLALPAVPLLLAWRAAGVLYLLLRTPLRVVLWLSPAVLVGVVFFADKIFPAIVAANYADMNFRTATVVPSFADLGILGIFLRGLVWPVLALTGGFFVVSPAFAYFPLALGSVALLIYNAKIHKSASVHWAAFLPMVVFAALAPGFTSFFRYVFPILVCLPVYLANRGSRPLVALHEGEEGLASGR